jgi:MFS family permease
MMNTYLTFEGLGAEGRKRIRRLQIFCMVIVTVGELFLAGDWYGFAAVIPFVSKSLHLSAGEAGFAQGAFAITYIVGLLIWSPLGRNMQARALFALGLVGTGSFMLIQAFASTYPELLIARFLIGLFDSAVWVGTMKLIVAWFPVHRRGTMMGILLAAFSLAITMDFAIGIPVSDALGWRYFLGGLGVLTVLSGVIGGLSIRNHPSDLGFNGFRWDEEETMTRRNVPIMDIFRSRWIYIGGLAIFGDTFAIAATATWVVPAFIQVQHMPVDSAAVIGTIMGLSQVLFLLIGGHLSDRISRRTLILQIGALLATISAASFIIATIWKLPFGGLIALAAFSGVAVFSGGAIFSLLSQKYGDELAAPAIGYAEVGGILSTFVAPTLMGVTIDATHSFSAAFVVFAIAELLILFLLLIMTREGFTVTPYRAGT